VQPAYRIVADGTDVTHKLHGRLVSLTVVDEAGRSSDRAEITLDDRDHALALPPAGASLKIALGFTGKLVEIGTYIVEGIGGRIAPDTLTVTAKAAALLGTIRARKTREWKDVTVRDIVAKIAAEHGLRPLVGDSLAPCFYPYRAQTSESDLHFLTRIAHDLDAVAKPASGALIFTRHGEGKAADGTPLPTFTIHRNQIGSGSWNIAERGRYRSVTAEWGDRDTATAHRLTAGQGEPELLLRHPYATRAEARCAAEAALDRSQRTSAKLSIQLGGFHADLMAEAKVDLQAIKPELNGQWLLTRVIHRLDQSLTTGFEAERDNETAQR